MILGLELRIIFNWSKIFIHKSFSSRKYLNLDITGQIFFGISLITLIVSSGLHPADSSISSADISSSAVTKPSLFKLIHFKGSGFTGVIGCISCVV